MDCYFCKNCQQLYGELKMPEVAPGFCSIHCELKFQNDSITRSADIKEKVDRFLDLMGFTK